MATHHRCTPRVTPEPPSVLGARWIPLTRGRFTLVDEVDFERLMRFNWHLTHSGYAARRFADGRTYYMHHVVFGDTGDTEIDHIDGDRLNNRCANLRQATHQQNGFNLPVCKRNTSGFKGVSLDNRRGLWVARLSRYWLGEYKDPVEAACVYNDAARKRFGRFARLNRMDRP